MSTDDTKGTRHVADEFKVEMPDGTTRTGYVALGDPRNPHRGELLTVDEEKRIDAAGEKVVDGLTWSDAATGLYLNVLVAPTGFGVLGGVKKAIQIAIPAPLCPNGRSMSVYVGTTVGKATATTECAGASLELPSDLGRDAIKRRYVTEWFVHTAIEALALYGITHDVKGAQKGQLYMNLAIQMSAAVEDVIMASGL